MLVCTWPRNLGIGERKWQLLRPAIDADTERRCFDAVFVYGCITPNYPGYGVKKFGNT